MSLWPKVLLPKKTLTEMAAELYAELGCNKKDVLPKDSRGTEPIGYWPRVAMDLQRLLSSHPDKFDKMTSDNSSFEWLANVHQIFNATLMNMDLMINKYNIDRYVIIEVDTAILFVATASIC